VNDGVSDALAVLQARRSVAPRRLGAPGPDDSELQRALQVALRAPDHGGLVPWRLIQIPHARRDELATLFEQEKQRRDPLATANDLARTREHASNAPTLLAFVVCPRHSVSVPAHEQWLAAGAALGNLLHALQALGYGAIMLSGERCADRVLCRALGLHDGEVLAGFVSAGTVVKAPAPAPPKPMDGVLTPWPGAATGEPANPATNPSTSGPASTPDDAAARR